MKILKLTTAALAAATALGLSGVAMAAPAGNLGNGQQTAKSDDAVKQVRHRHWHHRHGYYYSPYYYRPYYRPYYTPYYYGGPSFNFGIQIR